MTRRLTGALALLVGAALAAGAQPAPASEVLTLDAFLARVRGSHPLVRQAEASRVEADARALAARGGFDPYISAVWDTKRFKGIGYYDEFDARLVLPTRWGLDFKLGWERAAGQIINPERATPVEGLWSLGVALPIGPRLFTDERRTALRAAEIALDAADADRDAALAGVVESAARDWGSWAEADRRARIAEEGVTLARFRFEAVRRRVVTGDAAGIDSVEARAELIARELQLVDARAAARGARLTAEAWLWNADGSPATLPAGVRPAELAVLGAESALQISPDAVAAIVARHPFVQQANAKWRTADAQRQLAAANVLPSASVDLSGLAAGNSLGAVRPPTVSGEETKFSGGLRLPLFVRKELGTLRAAEQRARALRFERDRVLRDVEVKARRALIEIEAVDTQLERQREVVSAAERLLAAEQQRFDAGESSLLVVNLRERTLLDERMRLATLVGRRARALGTLAVALGQPGTAAGTAGAMTDR